MATITIDGFILAQENWQKNGFNYTWAMVEMPDYGYMTIKPHVVEFDLPEDFNPTAAMLEALNAEKRKIQREFNARIAEINDKITNLQALTFNPTTEAA